ncbi:MAG: hypothetical protein LBQ05_01635, partial [Christensenellaceae bacterium]|nr:hypothetical protein [Christensenellaceae bacterium]
MSAKHINRFKPAKNPKKTIKDILRFIKPYLRVIILCALLAVGSCVIMLFGPNLLGKIASELEKGFGRNGDGAVI